MGFFLFDAAKAVVNTVGKVAKATGILPGGSAGDSAQVANTLSGVTDTLAKLQAAADALARRVVTPAVAPAPVLPPAPPAPTGLAALPSWALPVGLGGLALVLILTRRR